VHSASISSTTASPCNRISLIGPTNKVSEDPFLSTSKSSSETSDEDSPWTVTDHRCHKKRGTDRRRSVENPTARKDLVKEAEKQLTEEEKQRIHNRKCAEEQAQTLAPSPSSLDEGPSKGKSVDPQNWGNAGLDELDLDLEGQREALHTWA
jgi:hypothetical protein